MLLHPSPILPSPPPPLPPPPLTNRVLTVYKGELKKSFETRPSKVLSEWTTGHTYTHIPLHIHCMYTRGRECTSTKHTSWLADCTCVLTVSCRVDGSLVQYCCQSLQKLWRGLLRGREEVSLQQVDYL